MNNDINILLDKYEQGKCSVEEIEIVEKFLLEAEQEIVPEYQAFIDKEREISSSINLNEVLSKSGDELTIDQLMDKYEAGDCSSEEVLKVERLFSESEAALPSIYSDFIARERELSYYLEIGDLLKSGSEIADEELLSRYERNLTTSEESKIVESLFTINESDKLASYESYINMERQRSCNINVAELIAKYEESKSSEAKVVPMGKQGPSRLKSLVGMAALLVVALSAIILIRPSEIDSGAPLAVVNGVEIYDSEKALEYTLAALGTTSSKLKKGTDNMSILKELRHTSIYK